MHRANPFTLCLWQRSADGAWRAARTPAALEPDASRRTATVDEPHRPFEIGVLPLHQVPGFVGALLVAEKWSRHVSLDGVPLPAGIHLLRHAVRLDVFQESFWISSQSTVEEVAYDPAVHGSEVFCLLTKVRLTAGQPIKICPGLPGTICGVIYKAAAWDMAMQTESPLRCPHCGYRPADAAWHPPAAKTRRSLDGIAQLLRA